MTPWEITVGLEVHVQLATRTKLFCRCACAFGAPPNSLVCPVCLGHPGVLPVLNRKAVDHGIQAALVLGMEVHPSSKFDRKNYFYPDLPKGYQISQFDEPIATGGAINLSSGRSIRIHRLHLEEDAGKNIHDRGAFGLVDFNRAGTPLAEIVSEPDIASAEEARAYLEELRGRLRWAGVGDCDMEKGNLRVDVNVSVAPEGQRVTGTRAEVKNVNSFSSVVAAIHFERDRQVALLEAGERVVLETRTWDEESGKTRSMRSKEEADDYRYFPEPDLPRLEIDPEHIQSLQKSLPESSADTRRRWERNQGLPEKDAGILAAERSIALFFDSLLGKGVDPAEASKWVQNGVLARVSPSELEASNLTPAFLSEVLEMLAQRKINRQGVGLMLDAAAEGNDSPPSTLLESLGLGLQDDPDELDAACNRAIQAMPSAAKDVEAGKEKAVGALMGFVMKESGGRADPDMVRNLLLQKLRG